MVSVEQVIPKVTSRPAGGKLRTFVVLDHCLFGFSVFEERLAWGDKQAVLSTGRTLLCPGIHMLPRWLQP